MADAVVKLKPRRLSDMERRLATQSVYLFRRLDREIENIKRDIDELRRDHDVLAERIRVLSEK